MIVGDRNLFAIESEITRAYSNLSLRALGFFQLHIGNHSYGIRAPDATMLACSFEKMKSSLSKRGKHVASFSSVDDGGAIADAYRNAIFAPNQEDKSFFGIPRAQFRELFYGNQLVLAPDGDEAFDDGSFVLQFDDNERVRLIGFKTHPKNYHHEAASLSDVWLTADEFYGVLSSWCSKFEAEWNAAPKISVS